MIKLLKKTEIYLLFLLSNFWGFVILIPAVFSLLLTLFSSNNTLTVLFAFLLLYRYLLRKFLQKQKSHTELLTFLNSAVPKKSPFESSLRHVSFDFLLWIFSALPFLAFSRQTFVSEIIYSAMGISTVFVLLVTVDLLEESVNSVYKWGEELVLLFFGLLFFLSWKSHYADSVMWFFPNLLKLHTKAVIHTFSSRIYLLWLAATAVIGLRGLWKKSSQ